MRIEAPPRGTVSAWNYELMIWEDVEEPVENWIVRGLAAAKGTSPKPLDDLQVVVGMDVYDELLKSISMHRPLSAEPLRQIYGAELVVVQGLPVPFEVRWATPSEQAWDRSLAALWPGTHLN